MRTRKPIASLSLDLDNKWSYMKTHGDPGWESLPSYLPVVVPRFLRLLELERMHAAFEDGEIVGGAGAFSFDLSVPGGTDRSKIGRAHV